MRIELAGWSSEGLRCPDIEIKLMTDDKIAPVSLIQMPNGTGKTTTLTMIRAAMSGEAQGWSAGKIKSLRRPGESHSEGTFTLYRHNISKHLYLARVILHFVKSHFGCNR
jgi:DNA sulfur modification protein DndD